MALNKWGGLNVWGEAQDPVSGSVSIILSTPSFTVGGLASLPQPVGSASFTIDSVTFSASGSTTLPQPNGSVNFAIDKPIFSGYATVSGIVIINGANSTLTLEVKSNKITL